MRGDFLLCVVLAVPLCALGQASDSPRLAGKLVITGSSTMAPLVSELARRFRALHPSVEITVSAGGSGRGVADTLAGKADIGMVSRDLKDDEKSLFAIPIARDGVVFVVHKSNPVRALTRAQARAVFTGVITDWRALGGTSAPIMVGRRSPGHTSGELVPEYLGIKPGDVKAQVEVGNFGEAIQLVHAHPNAITFFSMGAVVDAVQKGQPLKSLALDGIEAGVANVRDGTWPMARPLNLVTRQVPTGLARAFVEFALSPASRSAILDHDYVPY